MKPGDLVLSPWGETAILLTEPYLREDVQHPDIEPYYVADVYSTTYSCNDNWVTDDLEVISENR